MAAFLIDYSSESSLSLPRGPSPVARSPSPFSLAVQPAWLSSSLREPRLCFSSRASFLLRILIFFINFSPCSPDGSPSSSLSLFAHLVAVARTWVSPPYAAFAVPAPVDTSSTRASTGCTTDCPSRKRPTYLVLSLGLLSRQCPCPFARSSIRSPHDRDTVSDISFYFLLSPERSAFAKSRGTVSKRQTWRTRCPPAIRILP